MTALSTQEIAERVGGELSGRADLPITGVEQLDRAAPGQISFVRDAKFAADWLNSKASAALVSRDIEMTPGPSGSERAVIHVANAEQAMSVVLALFATPQPGPPPGVHPTSIVDATAQLGDAVAVGPHTVIGANCRIGDRCVIHGGVSIYNDCVIGSDTVLWPGVVIREQTQIGSVCIIHPNVTIGADGFGYHPDPAGGGLVKIPHIGNVHIGDQVEIGAGTCIDRGKFSSTSIGDGTKIDNLCQIAHNCRIGRGCILAGQVGLAGSVTLGDGVILGGKAAVRDQVTIGSGAQIGGVSAVMEDVPAGATLAGYPARDRRAALREHAALRKLPDIIKAFKKDRKQ